LTTTVIPSFQDQQQQKCNSNNRYDQISLTTSTIAAKPEFARETGESQRPAMTG
jgi:hypothetical protein